MSQPPKTRSSSEARGTKSLIKGNPFFGALAQPDRSHLGEGPDWRSFLPANGLDSGNECGSHGTHSGQKNSQFALGFGNFGPFFNHSVLSAKWGSPNEPKSCNESDIHGNLKMIAEEKTARPVELKRTMLSQVVKRLPSLTSGFCGVSGQSISTYKAF